MVLRSEWQESDPGCFLTSDITSCSWPWFVDLQGIVPEIPFCVYSVPGFLLGYVFLLLFFIQISFFSKCISVDYGFYFYTTRALSFFQIHFIKFKNKFISKWLNNFKMIEILQRFSHKKFIAILITKKILTKVVNRKKSSIIKETSKFPMISDNIKIYYIYLFIY